MDISLKKGMRAKMKIARRAVQADYGVCVKDGALLAFWNIQDDEAILKFTIAQAAEVLLGRGYEMPNGLVGLTRKMVEQFMLKEGYTAEDIREAMREELAGTQEALEDEGVV